ncbi:MerR family transcriptional regulator [Kineococcus gynurae]|uniref:MerR family transcriptional regulator n=1 Tax=Kineococcus gynurae TaxID=452979 RepID=A0ABV5LT98_9ACTN
MSPSSSVPSGVSSDVEPVPAGSSPAGSAADGPAPSARGAGASGARLTLTVAAVAKRLGVAPATLRTWDRRYGLGPSEHTAGEHRRYSATDIARLVVMRRLTLEGLPPGEAAGIAATTSVAAGGFALAEVATIPPAVVQAAMTDAAAVVGPDTELGLLGLAGTAGVADLGDRLPTVDGTATDPVPPRPAASTPPPAARAAAPHATAPRASGARSGPVATTGPDPEVVRGIRETVARLGAARAWDEELAERVLTGGPTAAAEVNAAVAGQSVPAGPRAVLVSGPASPVVPLAALALAELGLGSRCAGVGAPGRMLAAAVRRSTPPAVLLHAEGADDVPPHDGLLSLLAVRPAPLVVLSGSGWAAATVAAATTTAVRAGAVRAKNLAEAVARCASAVRA